MKIFGITGGSGSGKTSFSAILSELGVKIIDTDAIARKIVEPNSRCLKELTEYFGDEILNADGTLNRKMLAATAFSDDEKRAALNNITHKYIKAQTEIDIKSSKAELVAIDGAVIIGSNIEPMCEFIVSVIADREVRLTRIKERDTLTDEEALRRLSAQPDDEFYKEKSKYVIYNNSGHDALERQARMLYDKIKEV